MRVATRSRSAALLIWIAYFVVPIDAGGLIHGVPLGPIEAIGLLVIAWLAANRVTLPGAAIVAAVLGVSLAAAIAIPGTGGFRARYFANATATGVHERSTEFADSAFTRVDRRLGFAPGGPEFPLAFFNDNGRFNFYLPDQPHRRRLEFSVRWSGFWHAAGTQTVYLDAPQSTAELFVDGISAIAVTPANGSVTRELDLDIGLAGGWHRLDVVFMSPYGAPRRFLAGVVRNGQPLPFDSAAVFTQQINGLERTAAGVLRVIKTGADAAALAVLAWLFVMSLRPPIAALREAATARDRTSPVLTLLAMVGAGEALVFAWPWSRQTMLLYGGDDPMTYEGMARQILFGGILMTDQPIGQGEPFYYQAFYPYFLAALHTLFGEGMFGIILVQRLLVVFMIWRLVVIATELGGDSIWPAALGWATLVLCLKFWPIAADLKNESLYVPLLVAWTAALIHISRAPSTARALGTGVLGGFAAITRSTVLLGWPAVFPACWVAWKGLANRRTLMAALMVSSLAIFSLITIRNWIVAGQFAPTSTELGVTLLGGNTPPEGLAIDLDRRGPLYARLGIDSLTAQVIEYAIAAPGHFAFNLGRKALFALGFFEPYAPGRGYSPIYIAGWIAAAAGVFLALRAGVAPAAIVLVPVLLAVSQFVAVVVIFPKDERLIVPIHILLVPYAAIAFARLRQWMARRAATPAL